LFRKPTILNNVETFANIRAILTLGGKNYAKIGTPQSTGTKLLSLDSHFVKPGIYEVAMGTPLRKCYRPRRRLQIEDQGGANRRTARRYHSDDHIGHLTVDFESFKKPASSSVMPES
jgi:NADH:ubiquinone oxidoreductase subunit F (NADH-binding)